MKDPSKQGRSKKWGRCLRWLFLNRLVTPKWARRFMKVSHGKIYKLLATGEIPSVRVGDGSVRIQLIDLIRYIRSRKTNKEDSQIT